MAEFLPGVHVAHVHLNDRHGHGGDGVVQGHGGVGVAAGVEYHAVQPVEIGLLQRVDQRALVVALHKAHTAAKMLSLLTDFGHQVVEGFRAVDTFLPKAGEVDVGAVENQKLLHGSALL